MIFEPIYLQFDAKLRNFILGKVSDPDRAEDILQEVYLKINNNIGTLHACDRLEAWIYQITRNAIIDYYRRDRLEKELSESLPAFQEDEPDAVAGLTPSLYEMLNALPAKYRQAITLTEIQGLTQVELADLLGLSVSAAKSRVQRAREKLKKAFLDCCYFEFDRQGKVIYYEPKCLHCAHGSANYREDCEKPIPES